MPKGAQMFRKKLLLICFILITGICYAQNENILNKDKYCIKEMFDVLKVQDRDKILEYFPEYYHEPELWEGDFETYLYWYGVIPNQEIYLQVRTQKDMEQIKRNFFSIDWNRNQDKILAITCYPYYLVVEDFKIKGNEIDFSLWSLITTMNFSFSYIIKTEVPFNKTDYHMHKAKFVMDGDYLNFYIDDIYIHTFCKVDQNTLNEYERLMIDNSCDLSKVTWPRHADGTCDYDKKTKKPQPTLLYEELEKVFDEQNKKALK